MTLARDAQGSHSSKVIALNNQTALPGREPRGPTLFWEDRID